MKVWTLKCPAHLPKVFFNNEKLKTKEEIEKLLENYTKKTANVYVRRLKTIDSVLFNGLKISAYAQDTIWPTQQEVAILIDNILISGTDQLKVAMILVLCTGLRSAELVQLTQEHLRKIEKGESVNIKFKKSLESRIIAYNKILFENYRNLIYNNIPLKYSVRFYNSQIKQFLKSKKRGGLVLFRKYISTLLADIDLYAAKDYNRHKLIATLDHYVLKVNTTESELNKLF